MKNGFKALGLAFVAALALMAFSATGASAQQYLLGDPGATLGEKTLTAEGKQTEPGQLFVPGRGITIGCKTADIEGVQIKATVATGTFLFLECTVWVLKKGEGEHNYSLGSASPCHITNLEITAKAKIVPVLHNGATYLLASPLEEGKPFASFTFLSGTGCPLPLSTEVSGSVVATINQLNVVEQTIGLSPATQLLLKDELKYGTFPSYIKANGVAKLTGGEAGQAFGAH